MGKKFKPIAVIVMEKGILLCLIIFLTVLVSCNRNLFDTNYTGPDNYKNFYLVDTIIIKQPVIISSEKIGGRFVISKSLLAKFKDTKKFFQRPDVFLLGFDLYFDLPRNDYKRFHYPDYGNCTLENIPYRAKDVELYKFKKTPKYFLLGLINVNYYNTKHNSEDYYPIREKGQKLNYYKIVYPLCK